MPQNDLPFPEPSAAARRTMEAAHALAAAGDAAGARDLARPLLGEPALHAEALLLLLDLSRRLGDQAGALQYAARAARLAPKSARARALCAMALGEAGRPEEALAEALLARALDPTEARASVAAILAALRLGRPRAATDAALSLLRTEPCPPEAAGLAASLLDACTPGLAWGLVFARDGEILGLARQTAPEPTVVALTADGAALGRITAGAPVFPQAGLYGFSFPLPDRLAPGASIEASLPPTGQPLYGSPLRAVPQTPASSLQGRVGLGPDGRLVGHAYDPAFPDQRLAVTLFSDDPDAPESGDASTRLTVLAEALDADLLAKGHGDGRHAFSVDWPHDPQTPCARVSVAAAATGAPLTGSPVLVPNPPAAALALSRLNAWLRRAGEAPDAPPPLPEACRGPLLDFAREVLAGVVAGLEAQSPAPGEAHDA